LLGRSSGFALFPFTTLFRSCDTGMPPSAADPRTHAAGGTEQSAAVRRIDVTVAIVVLPVAHLSSRPDRALAVSPSSALVADLDRSEEHTSELQSPDHPVCRP